MLTVTRLATSTVLATVVICCGLAAQGKWQFRASANNPRADSPAMAFDSYRRVSVLTVDGPSSLETWEWDGTAWQPRLPTNSPYRRTDHAMAYDSTRDVVVLFGGHTTSGNATRPDTWEWDGSDWTMRSQTVGPPRRLGHALVYDPVRQGTLLFGGIDTSNGTNVVFADTWEWDGAQWSQLNPVTSPPPRHDHAMAYDSARGRIVLFGGLTGTTYLDDTWEWDGSNWFKQFPSHKPAARHGHAMAFDSVRGVMLLFGGNLEQTGPTEDTWEWNGTDWSLLTPSAMPASRYGHAMTFDAGRNVAVVYGGYNGAFQRDTWEYEYGESPSYTPFGSGCPGPQGAPVLSAQAGSRPIAGRQFTAQIQNLPLTGQAWVFLGVSNQQYGALTLPFDLAPIGMTGCSLYVSGDLLYPVTNVLGSAVWQVDVPLALSGARFYNQVIATAPGATALGLIVSNAAEAVVGG